MGRYASDANAYGISDRSGFRYRLKDMRLEWNGFLVGEDEYEPKHPQLSPPNVPADPQALKNPRPEQDLVQQRNIQWGSQSTRQARLGQNGFKSAKIN